MEDIPKTEAPLEVEPEIVQAPVDEKAALRAKNREKKRKQRAKEKVARDAVKAEKEAKAYKASLETMTNSLFWEKNRKELSAKQIAEYTAREEEVIELEIAIENVVFSRLDTYALHVPHAEKWFAAMKNKNAADESYAKSVQTDLDWFRARRQRYLEEGLVEAIDLDLSDQQIQELESRVKADVEKHGTLSIGSFRGVDFANPAFRRNFDHWFSDGPAYRPYIMYGFITAISGRLLIDFGRAVHPPSYGMRCQCGATTKVQDASEVVPHWRCGKCAERDRKQAEVNAQLDKIREQAVKEPDVVYDKFGRFKDNGR